MSRRANKPISWRMTHKTYMLYLSFGAAAAESPEGSDAQLAAIEGLKMLPGYPGPSHGGDASLVFLPEVIDSPTVTVH